MAYELIPDGTTYLEFTTFQTNMGTEDVDYYYFTATDDGYATVNPRRLQYC